MEKQSGIVTGFRPSNEVFPCQYHSTIATYSFIHLPPSSVLFFSHYFRIPLSVSFHKSSIHIPSPTTHAVKCFSLSASVFPCQYHSTIAPYSFIHLPSTLHNVFLPVLQFPLSVSFHHCSILIHSSNLAVSRRTKGLILCTFQKHFFFIIC